MRTRGGLTAFWLLVLGLGPAALGTAQTPVRSGPPLGWNSWCSLGMEATEDQVMAVVEDMADRLKAFGWEYVVIDAGWYHPASLKTEAASKMLNPPQTLDGYGRQIPDPGKFPSSAGGAGFRHLADLIHGRGLKFGLHLMRGIPWNAVAQNLPIFGSEATAKTIAQSWDVPSWSKLMKGVGMSKPGAQEYYDSVFAQFAAWGVDFVKVDDMSLPFHDEEIEAVRLAIERSGRPMILSLSPGPAPLEKLDVLRGAAALWRITADRWDTWSQLKATFEACRQWQGTATPGHWPDADMLPLGRLRKNGAESWVAGLLGATVEETSNEDSRLTDTEKTTLMTLFSIFGSPLMLGGYLPESDPVTLGLITNPELLAVDQTGTDSREVFNQDGHIVWISEAPGEGRRFVALFSTGDPAEGDWTADLPWSLLGFTGPVPVRDLLDRQDLGTPDQFRFPVVPHGCRLFQLGR